MSAELIQQLAPYGTYLFLFLVIYFIWYRPQKKVEQRRNDMINNLKKGDRIITSGGIYGTVTGLSEEVVTIKVSEKVEIDVQRSAVRNFQVEPENNKK